MRSYVQDSIINNLRAREITERQGLGLAWGVLSDLPGWALIGPGRNILTRTRSIVPCGACNEGRLPVKDEKGQRISGKNTPCPRCEGTGVRVNRRYGSPGKRKPRNLVT